MADPTSSTPTVPDGPGITADDVYAEAVSRYGEDKVGAQELGDTYESMQAMAKRMKRGVFYTPQPVAAFTTRFALESAIGQVGPEPGQLLSLTVCDPSCGCGIFLVEAARQLSYAYAQRLVGGEPSGDLMLAVMPRVVLECVFGVDIDLVSAELAKRALSIETVGSLTPAMLDRHIIAGNTLDGDSPPAMDDKTGPTGSTARPTVAAGRSA